MQYVAVDTPLRWGNSSSTRGWNNHGFLNDVGGSSRPIGTRVKDIYKG